MGYPQIIHWTLHLYTIQFLVPPIPGSLHTDAQANQRVSGLSNMTTAVHQVMVSNLSPSPSCLNQPLADHPTSFAYTDESVLETHGFLDVHPLILQRHREIHMLYYFFLKYIYICNIVYVCIYI